MIKKYAIITMILFSAMILSAEKYDDYFWSEISKGKLLSAAERGNSIGLQKPHYHFLSSFIYMILNNSDENQEQYNLFNERISDFPPDLIEKEFKYYLNKFENSYVYAFIGSFTWQYRNSLNLNGQEILYQAYSLNKRNYIANNYLSMFEYNKGNIEGSLNYALASIEESDNYSEPYVNAANSYDSMGKREEAIEILFQALEECREPHFNAYLSLFYKLGRVGSGIIRNFDQTLNAEIIYIENKSLDIFHNKLKNLPNIYYSLIENLIEKGCYPEAEYLLNRSSEIQIDDERIVYLEVKRYFKAFSQNGFNDAVIKYNNLQHSDSEIVADVAYMSLMFENYDGAVKLYDEFIKMKPNMKSYRLMISYSNLGTAYANLKKYNEAFKSWNLALEIVPDDKITLANIEKFTSIMNE